MVYVLPLQERTAAPRRPHQRRQGVTPDQNAGLVMIAALPAQVHKLRLIEQSANHGKPGILVWTYTVARPCWGRCGHVALSASAAQAATCTIRHKGEWEQTTCQSQDQVTRCALLLPLLPLGEAMAHLIEGKCVRQGQVVQGQRLGLTHLQHSTGQARTQRSVLLTGTSSVAMPLAQSGSQPG